MYVADRFLKLKEILLCTSDSKRYWSPTDLNFWNTEIYNTAKCYNRLNGNRKAFSSDLPSPKRSRFLCKITVRMPDSIVNHTLLQRHKNLIREICTEPKRRRGYGNIFIKSLHPVTSENNRNIQKPTIVSSKGIKPISTAIEQRRKPNNTIVIE